MAKLGDAEGAIQLIFKANPVQFVEESEKNFTVRAPVVEVTTGTANVTHDVPDP
jgi:hypothetical protein